MKKVFTNADDVIHLFAQQTQEEGRSTNTFFYGKKLYSYGYHYLLAEFITNKKNEEAIYINDEGYSSTTSKHIWITRQATSQYRQFFKTECDIKNVLYTIEQNVKKLQNARKKELYINPSLRLFNKLNEFLIWSNTKKYKSDPNYKKIVNLISIINDGNYAEYLKKEEARIKRDERREAKRKRELLKVSISKFKNYDIDRLNGNGNDFLRISKDKTKIETSQNISIEVKEAKRLLKLIDRKKIIGAEIDNKYTVTAFNGLLKVGCHNIPIEEINEIRTVLTTI